MFRKLALPIALPILLVTLLFAGLKTPSPKRVAAQEKQPIAQQQIVLPPFTNTYRIGILADITTQNVWAIHDTQQSAVNDFVLSDLYPSLYRFSDQQQAWVPYLAQDFPTALTPSMGYIVSQVPLKSGLQWSDGSSLTAVDVAFTINTAITMSLSGDWQAYNNAYLHHAEATSPLTLTLFYSVTPTIEQHQFGTLMGPIVSQNYWAVPVADAIADSDPVGYLYNFISANEPTAGPFTLFGRVPGVIISLAANPYYALKGAKITHYVNGAYEEIGAANAYTITAYGTSDSDVDLSYVIGPYFDEVNYQIFSTESEATTALAAGDIDLILNENSLSAGLLAGLTEQLLISGVENGRNQLTYLGLNHNYTPLDTTEFRQALSIWLNRQAVGHNAGQDVVPTWDLLPDGQRFWYTPTTQIGVDLFPHQRVNEAVTVLADAGFTWDITPTWNINNQTLIPGDGLRSPTGTLLSPMTLLAQADDVQLTDIAPLMVQALNDLGLSVTAVLTTTPAFTDLIWTQQNFDIFIANWDLDNTPSYLCTAFSNAPSNISSYNNTTLNALCDDYLNAPDMLTARPSIWQGQAILANDLPYVPLFALPLREAYRLDRVYYPYTDALNGLAGRNGLTAVARPVITASIQPDIGTTLIYTSLQGTNITIEIGPGSVSQPFVMLFMPQSDPGYPLPSGRQFINHAFDLEVPQQRWDVFLPYMAHDARLGAGSQNERAYLPLMAHSGVGGLATTAVSPYQAPRNSTTANSFFFLKPITITIEYQDSDVMGLDEMDLQLLYWGGNNWQDAGQTCGGNSPGYEYNPLLNTFKVFVCHFSRFATVG